MQGVVLPDARSGAAAHNIESKLEIERRDEQKILLHHRALHAVGQFVGTPFRRRLWIWMNTAESDWKFDEYPFPCSRWSSPLKPLY